MHTHAVSLGLDQSWEGKESEGERVIVIKKDRDGEREITKRVSYDEHCRNLHGTKLNFVSDLVPLRLGRAVVFRTADATGAGQTKKCEQNKLEITCKCNAPPQD